MPTSTPEEIKVGEVAIRFLVEGEQSAGSVAVFEFDVPAGARVPVAHSHDGYEETIYGLEGVLTWTIEGTPTDVGPGPALCIPAAPSTATRSGGSGWARTAATESAQFPATSSSRSMCRQRNIRGSSATITSYSAKRPLEA